jgi:hypothetical protein
VKYRGENNWGIVVGMPKFLDVSKSFAAMFLRTDEMQLRCRAYPIEKYGGVEMEKEEGSQELPRARK